MSSDGTGGWNLARFTSSHESKGSRVWLRGSNIVNPRNGGWVYFLYLSRFIQTNFSHESTAWLVKNVKIYFRKLKFLAKKNVDYQSNRKAVILIILGARKFKFKYTMSKPLPNLILNGKPLRDLGNREKSPKSVNFTLIGYSLGRSWSFPAFIWPNQTQNCP